MAAKKGNKYAVGNKGGGRKTTYKKEYADLAYKFCLLGAIDKELADFFEVAENTINVWKRKHKEFELALKEGKEQADTNVADRLYQRAIGYSHPEEKLFQYNGEVIRAETIKHYPPDTTAMIFWLKNRQKDRWRDRQDHELTGKDGRPIQTEASLHVYIPDNGRDDGNGVEENGNGM
jgi:hypothetical protein